MSNKTNYTELHMKTLGMSDEIIKKYNKGIILCSDSSELIEPSTDLQKTLQELQQKYQDYCEFYHIVYSYLYGCPTYNFLYCPKNPEEAEYDMEFLEKGIVRSYCLNLYIPEFSESGDIHIKKTNDTFVRIG